jgi:hypothetical protein
MISGLPAVKDNEIDFISGLAAVDEKEDTVFRY